MIVFSSAMLLRELDDNKAFRNDLVIHLFQNDHIPAQSDSVGAYTEADYPGYASQLTDDWGDAVLNVLNEGESDHPPLVFTMTGPSPTNMIYGYYLTFSGLFIAAERHPAAPLPFVVAGASVTVVLRKTERNRV